MLVVPRVLEGRQAGAPPRNGKAWPEAHKFRRLCPGFLEPRRLDFLRLLRQVPDISEVSYIDANGREHIKTSRLAMDKLASEMDFSQDPKFTQATRQRQRRTIRA